MRKSKSRSFSGSTVADSAPTDLKDEQTEEHVLEVDFSKQTIVAKQEFEVELEYDHRTFPVGAEDQLETTEPLTVKYSDSDGKLEILGWGLSVDLRESNDLPRRIGKRFLELYSRSVRDELSDQDEACFEKICEQVDYRRFCRSRELPRFREALLVRKQPTGFLKFLDGKKIKISSELTAQLRVLDEGQYFGALFEHDDSGDISGIKNIIILPFIDSAEVDKQLTESVPNVGGDLEVPDHIRELL